MKILRLCHLRQASEQAQPEIRSIHVKNDNFNVMVSLSASEPPKRRSLTRKLEGCLHKPAQRYKETA
jgi:hypothetical protein